MRKMNVVDAAPINMAMPTPPASPVPEAEARVEDSAPPSLAEPAAPAEQHRTPPPSPPIIPVSSHTTTASHATTPAAPAERSRTKTPDTPLGSTASTPPSPPAPAQSEEVALPLPYMLLWSQLQRIEARQMNFQVEFKVFQSNLIKFLNFQFPASAAFFGQPSHPPPQPSVSAAATAAQPSTNTSAKEGATEEVHLSFDDKNDIFDWQSPRDHLLTLGPVITTPAPAAPILSTTPTPTTSNVAERPTPDSPARKRGKMTAGRTIGRDDPSSPEEEADQRPAKRRRRYHVINVDSDDDDSSAELPVPKPRGGGRPAPCQEKKKVSRCEEAVLGLHHMRQKYQLHFKECMIQELCELLWLPETGSRQIIFCILEVPGFMPGMINQAEYRSSSIVAVKSCTEATWSIKAQNLLRQSFGPEFSAPADKRSIERDFDFISIFFSMSLFYERVRKKAERWSKSKTRSPSALRILGVQVQPKKSNFIKATLF
ncbi:hypothetical protein V6N11_071421 [Hibiscus sabdariffa]|uniref:Uncharacterized protein n=1 Tax=Hibiscus sabdariffa TaxID=183260 RepID=A0ABR2U0D8_9ROSI